MYIYIQLELPHLSPHSSEGGETNMAVKRQYMVGFTQLDAHIDENSKNIYLIMCVLLHVYMCVVTCMHVCLCVQKPYLQEKMFTHFKDLNTLVFLSVI